MAEHYYSQKPTVKSDRQIIEETLRGRQLRFVSDAGVFSKSGVDFGSKLLVQSIEIHSGARVLDVGCGYGPIGLSIAATVPGVQVTMVDMNERAVALSQENAKLNHVSNVQIQWSDLLSTVKDQKFDVIVSNPPIRAGKATVHQLFEDALAQLVEGGSLWIVIQKKQGAPSALAKLESLFAEVNEIDRDKGYWILQAVKKTS